MVDVVNLTPGRRSVRGRLRRYSHAARNLNGDSARERIVERLRRFDEKAVLRDARGPRDVCWTESDDSKEPLVTIRIATAGRPDVLRDRSLRSAVAQTYRNIEVVVVSDGPDSGAKETVESLADPRVRYYELGRRTVYPPTPRERWLVAGYAPMNLGTWVARGDWIAPCDDDDELLPDHVETLIKHAKEERLELVYSDTEVLLADSPVKGKIGHPRLRQGHITHGSVLISAGLRHFMYSATSYRLNEAFDWNLWKRMAKAGVKIGYINRVTYRYYASGPNATDYRAMACRDGADTW